MQEKERLFGKYGGFRKLKTFQLGRLIYDLTVRFCRLYIEPYSRTYDQMVQAARSGVQNIAEGSHAGATSKKTEIKLTNVARASLEELRLDYEDFLRQRDLPLLVPNDPMLKRFKARKCAALKDVQEWITEEKNQYKKLIRAQEQKDTNSKGKYVSAGLAANAALSLINIECYLLDNQIEKQLKAFENGGGFTERLYQIRSTKRQFNR